mgnify:CR=1 FL=1
MTYWVVGERYGDEPTEFYVSVYTTRREARKVMQKAKKSYYSQDAENVNLFKLVKVR